MKRSQYQRLSAYQSHESKPQALGDHLGMVHNPRGRVSHVSNLPSPSCIAIGHANDWVCLAKTPTYQV